MARRCVALLVVSMLGCSAAAERTARSAAPVPEWGLAFYMSYDNDLDRMSEGILEAIRAGTERGSVVAAVEADSRGQHGIRRYLMRHGAAAVLPVGSEDSADERHALEFLRWFARSVPARRYAVVFLDHGGDMDQMCSDESPGTAGPRWMSGQALGHGLRQLREELPGRWELLFLQQCGRGSLENLYSFRDTADWIMSSPLRIGAPNTYYTPVMRELALQPELGGRELCARIAASDQHYAVYSCADGSRLADIPAELRAASSPFVGRELRLPTHMPALYVSGDEQAVDAVTYFRELSRANRGLGAREVDRFAHFVEREVVRDVHHAPRTNRLWHGLSGASLFVPSTLAHADRYSDHECRSRSDLPALWSTVLLQGSKLEPSSGPLAGIEGL
jgi:hypothetical protein